MAAPSAVQDAVHEHELSDAQGPAHPGNTYPLGNLQDHHPQRPGHPSAAGEPPCELGRPGGIEALAGAMLAARRSHLRGQPDPRHLVDVLRFNVFFAFAHNARTLGFDDGWLTYDAVSPLCTGAPAPWLRPARDLPPSLVPTALQLAVEHHPWIDFLPCPRMRDNFLRRVRDHGEDSVDEDALCVDIVDAASAREPGDVCLVTWGHPWELSEWEVTEAFWKKWSWLLEGCSELLMSTNFWRAKRGLDRLETCQAATSLLLPRPLTTKE